MKTNKIRLLLCLGAALAAVLLGGCGAEPVGGDGTPTTKPTLNSGPLISVPTTGPTEPTWGTTAPTEETEPPPSLEPVTKLTAVKWSTVPQLLSLGNGNVLACRNDYEEGKGDVNLLEVFNVYEDKLVAQKKINSPMELVDQSFEDGQFILKAPESNTFYVYGQDLQTVNQFSAPNIEGYFSHNLENYYFVDNNVLYRMDVATGSYARMALEYDIRLESLIGFHPDWDIVVARFYLSFYNENCGVCAIDCSTGKMVLLNKTASHLWFDGDTFYAAVTNDSVYGSDICYGSLSSSTLQKAVTGTLGSDTASYAMLPGSGILMHRTVDENALSTTVYDLSQGGISCQLAQYDYLTATLGSVYLRQEQLIFGVYPQNQEFYPVVIDPKVLTYEKSLSISKEIWPALVDRNAIMDYLYEVEGPTLPDSLQTLRRQADDLEEKYGIRILMENQTLALCGSYASAEADPGLISNALTVLDQALSLYPEGFLKQFQNGIREGGLRFCLTGPIQGSLNPVGKAVKTGSYYDLVLDITSERPDRTVHHELWHAIEMKLSTDSFDQTGWNAVNPKGFLYYGHYDSGHEQLTQWTYAQSGDRCCFVDAYSQINPREDRARIMEAAMTGDSAAMLRSPVLQKKLQIMSQAIREHFDTKGWKTPYWEQYL